jgi:TPP-dependent pyruvate/acetoin dehydrogenase alpha subunit
MPQLEHEGNRIRSTNEQREPMEYETRYMVENERRDPINSANQRIADEGISVAQTFDCRDRKYVKELSEDRKFMGQITE